MQYLTALRDQIESHLDGKISSDATVGTFWSSDIIEFENYVAENQRRVGKHPHVYVTCPNFTQNSRRGIGTAAQDSVTVWVWVVYRDSRSEERLQTQADEISVLTRAYLSEKQFGLDFTNDNTIENWNVTVETETDDTIIYSVVGELDLEVDNAKLINTYES